MDVSICALSAHHDRADFDCGEAALNSFLQTLARQQAARDFSRTYVAVDGEQSRIRGYYALSAGAIEFQNWPPELKLPRYPIPVARIGRLAVDIRDQGAGIGRALLRHALHASIVLADQIGLHAVVVDAKHARAAEFYNRFGFQALRQDGRTLYLLMPIIRRGLFGE
jgi:predicted N-acetyltransferase YhbS